MPRSSLAGRRYGGVLAGVLAALAGAVAGLLVIGATGGLGDWGFGSDDAPAASGSSPRAGDPVPVAAPSVLPAASTTAPVPTAAGVARALATPLDAAALGDRVGVVVLDPLTRATLFDQDATRAQIPASTAKLVTASSVLHFAGPDRRFTTRTVTGSSPDQVVLVGGGDPTLVAGTASGQPRPASLTELARQTATALRASGRTSVALLLDDTLFTGPRTAPGWLTADLRTGLISPVTALAVDRPEDAPGPPPADPTAAAGRAFASALEDQGIEVTSTRRGAAPTGSPVQLASVTSPTVSALVERMLLESDNDIAEALSRAAGLAAGTGGSFTGGSQAAEQTLSWLGLDPATVALVDGSGLSKDDQVEAETLGDLLAVLARGEHPELASVLTGLPVAGVTGSLADRYTQPPASAARGDVRAKTGTLTGVNGLAGTVVDREGRTLVLVVLADRSSTDTFAVRAALDRVAAALARCGCR